MKFELLKSYILSEIGEIELKNHRKKMNTKEYYKIRYYYEIYKYMEKLDKFVKENKKIKIESEK